MVIKIRAENELLMACNIDTNLSAISANWGVVLLSTSSLVTTIDLVGRLMLNEVQAKRSSDEQQHHITSYSICKRNTKYWMLELKAKMCAPLT